MAVQVMAMILSEMTLVEEGVYQEMAMTRSEKALEVGVEAQEMAQRYQDAGAEEQEKLVVTVLMSVVVEEVV